jgi:hypothetical protein
MSALTISARISSFNSSLHGDVMMLMLLADAPHRQSYDIALYWLHSK